MLKNDFLIITRLLFAYGKKSGDSYGINYGVEGNSLFGFGWLRNARQWNELGKLAQKFYADFSSYNYNTLLKKFDKTVKNILELVESKTDQQLYGSPWYTKWTMGRMIQFNTSSPYKNAHNRISKWQKQLKTSK